jgi:uncharacterized membrane protein
VLALAGAAVSGYLLWVRETSSTLICATGGCETVQSSPYSEVSGVPVALLGLAGYVALAATALPRGESVQFTHTALALAAAVFSTYLLYVQLELIGAVCDWCVVSDGIVTGLAILALLRSEVAAGLAPVRASSATPTARPSGMLWIVSALRRSSARRRLGSRVCPDSEKRRVHVRHCSVERIEDDAAEREAGDHLPDSAEIEGGDEQAEGGRGEHDASGEAEETVEQRICRVANDQERETAHACCEARPQDPQEGACIHRGSGSLRRAEILRENPSQIEGGDDADGAIPPGDNEMRDAVLSHQLRGAAQGRFGCNGDGRGRRDGPGGDHEVGCRDRAREIEIRDDPPERALLVLLGWVAPDDDAVDVVSGHHARDGGEWGLRPACDDAAMHRRPNRRALVVDCGAHALTFAPTACRAIGAAADVPADNYRRGAGGRSDVASPRDAHDPLNERRRPCPVEEAHPAPASG